MDEGLCVTGASAPVAAFAVPAAGGGSGGIGTVIAEIMIRGDGRMKHEKSRHEEIHLGTHGEDYGSWMSNPVFYMIGGLLALSVVLAVLSFTVFRLPWLGAVFSVAAAAFLALLCLGAAGYANNTLSAAVG